jgi:hypothetical protein
MSKTKDPIGVAQGHIAYYSRRDVGDPAKVTEARREIAALKLAKYIQNVLATAPPLSQETRDKLAMLLIRGGDGK